MTDQAMNTLLRTDGIALVTGCAEPLDLAETIIRRRTQNGQGSSLALVDDAPLPPDQTLADTALEAGHLAAIVDVDRHPGRLKEALVAAGAGLSTFLLTTQSEPDALVERIAAETASPEQEIYRQYFVNRVRRLSAPHSDGSRRITVLDAQRRFDLDRQKPAVWSQWFSRLPTSDIVV